MIVKVIAVAFITLFVVLMLNDVNKEFSIITLVLSGVIILMLIFKDYGQVISDMLSVAGSYGVPNSYLKLVLKVIGIGYVCEFSSSVAKDCGAKTIASYIEFSCKIFIMMLSMPIFKELINMITGLL